MDSPSGPVAPAYGEPVSARVENYRWSVSEFVRAWEAGAFDHRVELVEGEVWPVVIGDWHGEVVGNVISLLRQAGLLAVTSTLPSGASLPDPDCWVRRTAARAVGRVGSRLSAWDPADVLLVVEVSDETLTADLTTKARIYGAAGWPTYWVVSPEAVYEHTGPTPSGYRTRVEHRRGERVALPFTGTDLAVDDLLGPPQP